MQDFLHYEIDIICILCLSLILYKVSKRLGREERFFCRSVWSLVLLCLLDLVTVFLNGQPDLSLRKWNLFFNTLCYIQLLLIAFNWFLYTENKVVPQHLLNHRRRMLYMLPVLFVLVLLVISLQTGLLFYVDQQNDYHRGVGYFLYLLVLYGYLLAAFFRPALQLFRERSYTKRRDCMVLASAVLIAAAGGVIQTIYADAAASEPAIMLAFVYMFLVFQEEQISMDPLTKINNRYQLYRYLSDRMFRKEAEYTLFLIMLDVDDFKQINDTYGHVEGDRALIQVAELLQQVCDSRPCFLGRYGGDEFVIVYDQTGIRDIEKLLDRLRAQLERMNQRSELPCAIHLSVGYAAYSREYLTVQQFIAAADAQMYVTKNARKGTIFP